MSQRSSFHHLLARGDAKIRLAVLGMLVGIFAGLIVCFFRFALTRDIPLLTDGMEAENFESLPYLPRFLFPVCGCLLIAITFHLLKPAPDSMGVAYIINKVQKFRGHLPVKNALAQFLGATLALLGGGSCGREGPAIHLGATTGSVMGYWLQLPHNSIRTLIACGSAAAISASFNTPIAGVIFAMEVIMMEYAITSFIPVIIASVSAAVVTQILFGNDPVFAIASTRMNSLWEIPFVALMGILLAILASLFVRMFKFSAGYRNINQTVRLLGIGVLTGSVGLFIPEVMGIGYDTLNLTIAGSQAISFLCVLLAAKLMLTAISLGLGLPGGVIGPTLMMGGVAGGIMGALMTRIFPGTDPAFYVLLGMCSMMGAALQAPLAALMTLLELSNNPNIILPAMIIIVSSNLTYTEVLKSKSVFLDKRDEQHPFSKELARFLNRYAITSLVQNNFIVIRPDMEIMALDGLLKQEPEWLILDQDADNKFLIKKSEIDSRAAITRERLEDEQTLKRHRMVAISDKATLQEALEIMQEAELRYAYIVKGRGQHGSSQDTIHDTIIGIVSIDDIIAFYRD